jgi:hypothetical protein
MQTRLLTLKRLAALYGMVEEMHSAELQRTEATVREVERAIGVQVAVSEAVDSERRHALGVGDRMAWTVAESLHDSTRRKQHQLQMICLEREGQSGVAREQYITSHLRSEQIKHVLEGVSEQIKIEEERRVQSESDARFLSRQRWNDAQNKPRPE